MTAGASVTQQQLMLATHQGLLTTRAGATSRQGAPPQQEPCHAQPATPAAWSSQLSYVQVLQHTADAAQQAACAADPAARLQCLLSGVGQAASQWLQAALSQLPPGAVVCCVSCLQSATPTGWQKLVWPLGGCSGLGDRLLISRVGPSTTDGRLAPPLLVQLPQPHESNG